MGDAAAFGKYRLIRPLAEGGMAEVFLAKQQGPEGFEKVVVVKRILSHLSKDREFVGMFLDEARVSARLAHPNVVQVFDFGQEQGSYYLAMEYLVGEDLRTLIRSAKSLGENMPSQLAAIILAGACEGLHYAHTLTGERGEALNIVHRDISPSNLLVTYQGVVKVLDFGIAKAEGKLVRTTTGLVKGKLPYMSPEQAAGKPLDGRSDVFALGAVLFEMLTGARLFHRDNELAVIKALTHDPIPSPRQFRAELPVEIEEIVGKALQRDRDKRYATAREMSRDLAEFIALRTYAPHQEQIQHYLTRVMGEEHIRQRLLPPTPDPRFAEPTALGVADDPSHLGLVPSLEPEVVDLVQGRRSREGMMNIFLPEPVMPSGVVTVPATSELANPERPAPIAGGSSRRAKSPLGLFGIAGGVMALMGVAFFAGRSRTAPVNEGPVIPHAAAPTPVSPGVIPAPELRPEASPVGVRAPVTPSPAASPGLPPLPLHVAWPAGAVSSNRVLISGTTAPGAAVSVDGVVAVVNPTGLFSATVQLSEGETLVEVRAWSNVEATSERQRIRVVTSSAVPSVAASDSSARPLSPVPDREAVPTKAKRSVDRPKMQEEDSGWE